MNDQLTKPLISSLINKLLFDSIVLLSVFSHYILGPVDMEVRDPSKVR